MYLERIITEYLETTEWKILRKKTCRKTVAEMERPCQEELLVAAEHRKREEASTIQERLGTKC
jgi:hypothetical protein